MSKKEQPAIKGFYSLEELAEPEIYNEIILFRLTPSMKDAVDALAYQRAVSSSQIVRAAVARFIDVERDGGKP